MNTRRLRIWSLPAILCLVVGAWTLYFTLNPQSFPPVTELHQSKAQVTTASEKPNAPQAETPAMRLFGDGCHLPGKPITISLYIRAAKPGQHATLILPPGLTLWKEQSAHRAIPAPDPDKTYSYLGWKLLAAKQGKYRIRIEVPGIDTVSELILVAGGWSRLEPIWGEEGEPPEPP